MLEMLFLNALLVAHGLELLDPSPAHRLADEEIALGVHGDRMQEGELAGHVTEPAETRQRPPALAIESPNDLIQAVGDVEVFLGRVQGEKEPPGRPVARKVCSPSFNRDVPLEVASLVENLDAPAFPVRYV